MGGNSRHYPTLLIRSNHITLHPLDVYIGVGGVNEQEEEAAGSS